MGSNGASARVTKGYVTFKARESTLGLPPMPSTMPATIDDLPVPFGPVITFRQGPGVNCTEL